MNLRPVCEYIDRAGGSLTVAVRLRGADEPPGTRVRLRLRRRSGSVVAVSDAAVVPRVNAVGVWTNAAASFVVDAASLPTGAFRLELARIEDPDDPDDDRNEPHDGSVRFVPVAPTTGLLASSRPEPIGDRRVQPLPAAGRPAVWLRLSSWTRPARWAWAARNGLRDLAFVARGRRFTWVRAARLITRPVVPRGPIWLIGERPETARDNGRALFAHLRRTRPKAPVYYVMASDSPLAASVRPLGNVVEHSSWRHRVLMLHADVLANAYSIKHMLPDRWHPGAYMNQCGWRLGARRVYLKHGVHLSPEAVKRANGGYDLMVTVGPGETAALSATSGYGSQLVQTGLARYDDLVPGPPSKTILFMPTWRRYLVPTLFSAQATAAVPYEGSTYQRFVEGFLSSDRLASLLDKEDLRVVVVPHYNLASLLGRYRPASRRITVLDAASADIPALLRTCDLLVTDYSSVHFDVAYVGTPVVYAQVDGDEYSSGHSAFSWFVFDRDGFGPITHDVESAVDAVAAYAASGFTREPRYTGRVERIFAHHDRSNCARIVEAIDELTGTTWSTTG